MNDNEYKDRKSMRNSIFAKQIFEIITIAIVLASILFSACYGLIDNCTTGTLLGIAIGYILGQLKWFNKDNNTKD